MKAKAPYIQRSPLKWAGSKYRVMPRLLPHMPAAAHCIDLFAGSGTVFLNTDYPRYTLCDNNIALINFFWCLTVRSEELINQAFRLFTDSHNKSDYLKHREEFNKIATGRDWDSERLTRFAALFLYLNRHSFNGLWRTNKAGEFNVPFNKKRLPYFPFKELRLFAEKARDTRTTFMCLDFRHVLADTDIFRYGSNTVIYCDPPYLPIDGKDSFTQYNGKKFTSEDHRELVTRLVHASHRHGARVVISNSDTEETREIYAPFELHTLNVNRSVAASGKKRQPAKEIIGIYPPKSTAYTDWPAFLNTIQHTTTEII
ncbi:TPA: DNA adenine methylase [Salmonella enterica subsp. enterica serovar Poona]